MHTGRLVYKDYRYLCKIHVESGLRITSASSVYA